VTRPRGRRKRSASQPLESGLDPDDLVFGSPASSEPAFAVSSVI